MNTLLIISLAMFIAGCAQYKTYKDSFCTATSLCEAIKEVKDLAKEAAKEAAKDAIKDAVKK